MNFDGSSIVSLSQLNPDVLNIGGKSTTIVNYKGYEVFSLLQLEVVVILLYLELK